MENGNPNRSELYQILRTILLPFYKLLKFGPKYFDKNLQYAYQSIIHWKANQHYAQWVKRFDLTEKDLLLQREKSNRFSYQPKFSFITPVYNPPANIFIEMLDSVLAQTYPNWELCLANGSTDIKIKQIINQYQASDSRIHSTNMINKGISGNSNTALELSTGTYLVLLDHDDRIAPDLLFEAVVKLNRKRNTDIIYYDEDKIELDGSRIDPCLKPRWFRYKQFLTSNFLNHSIFRRDLIDRVGMFLDPEMDGAQDWDFFYKCIEITHRIVHIPRVLYSWRKIEGSAALDTKQKPYALEKQNAAREAHLRRITKNK